MRRENDSVPLESAASYVVLPGGNRIHRAWIMMFGCSLLFVATVSLVFSPIGVFYNAVCVDMGFDRSEISIWQQVHFLVAIPCMPLSAKLLERFNARVVLSVCVIGCGTAAILMGTYVEAWQWCISGALYGSLGALGTLQLAGPVVIGNWFSKRTGVAMGLYGVVGAVASVIAPPVFEQIIANVGWRGAYFVQGVAILVIGLAFTVLICRLRPSEIGAVPYGGVPSEPKLSVEARSKVPWRAIASVPFAMLFIFAGISSLIGSGFDAHIAGHAVAKGYDTFFGSLMTSALFLGSGTDKFLMGWLNDKIGVNKVVFLEYALVVTGMLGLVFGPSPTVLIFAAFYLACRTRLSPYRCHYSCVRSSAWVACRKFLAGSASGLACLDRSDLAWSA